MSVQVRWCVCERECSDQMVCVCVCVCVEGVCECTDQIWCVCVCVCV